MTGGDFPAQYDVFLNEQRDMCIFYFFMIIPWDLVHIISQLTEHSPLTSPSSGTNLGLIEAFVSISALTAGD